MREPGGGEEPRLQEPEQDLRRAVDELRAELSSLLERVDAVEGRVSLEWACSDDGVDVEDVDAEVVVEQQWSMAAPRRVFPELITEDAEPGEELVYGEATALVVGGVRPGLNARRRDTPRPGCGRSGGWNWNRG